MFVFEEKTSLRKLYDRYVRVIQTHYLDLLIDTTTEFRNGKDARTAAREVGMKKTWEFLEYRPLGFVLAPSGHLVQLDEGVWEAPFDCYQPLNGYVNIQSGLLEGSDEQRWPSEFSSPASSDLLFPFEGCPVFILNEDDDLIFDVDDWQSENSADIARSISPMLDNELSSWFEQRANIIGIERPNLVEPEYIDGEAESSDWPDNEIEMYLDGDLAVSEERRLLKLFGVEVPDSGSRNSQRIVDYVLQAFPDGKGPATWETVQLKVGYSRRSIVRALKDFDVYYDWARGGQTKE